LSNYFTQARIRKHLLQAGLVRLEEEKFSNFNFSFISSLKMDI